MTAKLQIVQDVLRLGYDVLLTDVDIVFHKNVIPEVLEKCKDMCFMHDGPSKPTLRANTGFWFLRSGAGTAEFLRNTIVGKLAHVRMSEQAVVNALMKQGGIAPWLLDKASRESLKSVGGDASETGAEEVDGVGSKGGGKLPMEGSKWVKMKVKILQEKVYVNGHAMIYGTSLPPEMGIAHINWTRTKGQKKKYFRQWKMWKC